MLMEQRGGDRLTIDDPVTRSGEDLSSRHTDTDCIWMAIELHPL
jgi:hypothetical protein